MEIKKCDNAKCWFVFVVNFVFLVIYYVCGEVECS